MLVNLFFYGITLCSPKDSFPIHYPLMDSIGIRFNLERNLFTYTQEKLSDSTVEWWNKSILFTNYFSSSVNLFYPIKTIKNIWYEGYLNDPYTACDGIQSEYDRIDKMNYYRNTPLLLHTIILREKNFFLPKCNCIYEKYDSTIVKYFSLLNETKFQDPNKRIILDSIFVRIGRYPGRSVVGLNLEHTACKIILSGDLNYLCKYLSEIKTAIKQKELHPKYLAMILDKIEVQQNRSQIYGTQYKTTEGANELYPIKDYLKIDQLRASMGLGPINSQNSNLGNYFLESKKDK